MKKPNTIEAEIDAIRLKLYKKTKHMTGSELIAFTRNRVANIVLNPKYLTPEYQAEQDAYVKRVAAEYRAQKAAKKAAEAAQAALVFGEDSAEYKTQTT